MMMMMMIIIIIFLSGWNLLFDFQHVISSRAQGGVAG
jgi:hypothetical protein